MNPQVSIRPLKRKRLSEEISQQLKHEIFSGNLKPGDRLPSENQLREMFVVGRPVVREALRSLENSGLVYVKPGAGGGAFVKKISSLDLSETFEGIIRLDPVSMEELTEARLAVEMAMVPMICQNIRPNDIMALEQNIVEVKEALKNGIPDAKNLKFHFLLANASHNQLMTKITEALLRVLAKLLEAFEYSYERKKKILKDHEALLRLLKAKKYNKFAQTLEKHIRDTADLF